MSSPFRVVFFPTRIAPRGFLLAFGAVVIGIVDASMPHCVASATSERIHLVEPHAEAASPRFFGRFRHDAVDLGDERTVFGMMAPQNFGKMSQV